MTPETVMTIGQRALEITILLSMPLLLAALTIGLLVGVFQVSILHNIVHLLFGVAGFLAARTAGGARAFLIGGGAVYLVLWLYGLVIDKTSEANFVPLNSADDWLHFVLGIGMIGLGVALGRRAAVR